MENTVYQTPSNSWSNRQNSIGDRLTINEKYGIQGFNSGIWKQKNHNDSTDSRICT
jgi:hypothetical protein